MEKVVLMLDEAMLFANAANSIYTLVRGFT